MMNRLEDIVSTTFNVFNRTKDSITRIEDRAVNFLWQSDFVVDHPKTAGSILAGLTSTGTIYLQRMLFGESTTLWVSASVALGANFFISAYKTGFNKQTLKKQDIDPRKFDAIDRENLTVNMYEENGKKSAIYKRLPRTTAAFLTTALVCGVHPFANNIFPLPQTIAVDTFIGASMYLAFRNIFMNSRSFFKRSLASNLGDFSRGFGKLFENKKLLSFGINQLEKAANETPSIDTKLSIARADLEDGNIIEGLVQLKESTEEQEFSPSMQYLKGTWLRAEATVSLRAIDRGKATIESYTFLALALSGIGEQKKALQYIEDSSVKFPGIANDVIRALILEQIDEAEEAKDYWRRAIDAVYSFPKEKLIVLPAGEGGHFVRGYMLDEDYGLDQVVSNTLRFKRLSYREALHETGLISQLRQLYPDPRLIPQFLGNFQVNGYYDLVLRFIKGRVLSGFSPEDEEAYGYLLDEMYFTEWFHKTLSPSTSEIGAVYLHQKFEAILNDESLGLTPETIEDLRHIRFILNKLAIINEEDPRAVLARDPHPGQAIATKNGLVHIDFGDMGYESWSREIGKMISHPDTPLAQTDVYKFLEDVSIPYKEDGFVADKLHFILESLMAGIVQPLSYYSMWSKKSMEPMREKRAGTIATVPTTLEIIQQEFPDEYGNNKISYDRIADGFKRMEDELAA